MSNEVREHSDYIQLFVKALREAELVKGTPLTLSERARIISVQAHSAQRRYSDNQPYSVHTEFVANGEGFTEREKAIGYLHDVLEKTGLRAQDLIFLGIPNAAVRDIQRLSVKEDAYGSAPNKRRIREIPFFDGIERILDYARCRHVRERDITHNLSDRDAHVAKLREAVETGNMAATRADWKILKAHALYPLGLAFIKAANNDRKWRKSKTIIDFMRSAECPEQFRNQWYLLQDPKITSHPIPEALDHK
jgi:hypothetical protein